VRAADRRLRVVMLCLACLSVAGPFALTLLTYRDAGVVWQGRYGIPFSVGLFVLGGLALDRRPRATGRLPLVLGAGVAAYAAGHLVAVTAVLHDQRLESPSVALGLWDPPATWLVIVLTLAGWAVLTAVLLPRKDQERRVT
jgi:hypothetical protein